MPGTLALPAVCTALMCGAVDDDQARANLAPEQAPSITATATAAAASPFELVELAEFNGGTEYLKTAERVHNILLNAGTLTLEPGAPQLVDFDGAWAFLKASRRLRVWRPEVGFTMSVSADGKVTDCKLDNEFRKNYVNIKLCEVLVEHHTFKPAMDESNQPIAAVYHSKLSYKELREELD